MELEVLDVDPLRAERLGDDPGTWDDELRDLEVEYARPGRSPVRAVAGASLAVEAGQVVGLVGETGCGKSTLARAAVGLLRPTAGSVWFEGRQLRPIGRRARSRNDARLQMVFQNPFSSLNPRRRVGDQIADPMAILGLVPATGRRDRVSELLEQVGLPVAAARRFRRLLDGDKPRRYGSFCSRSGRRDGPG